MLQRIQTLFLLLVSVLAIMLFFVPLGSFQTQGLNIPLTVCHLKIPEGSLVVFSENWLSYVLPALLLLILVLTFYSIFRYKNRRSQIQLGKLNAMLHMALVVAAFLYIDHLLRSFENITFRYSLGIFFPLASLVLILLANRAIRKDEELVRSADRIR